MDSFYKIYELEVDWNEGTLDNLQIKDDCLLLDGYSMSYLESFESGIGDWINDGWDRNIGSTGSGSTGPSSAYDGSYYMYTENSSGAAGSHKYLTLEPDVPPTKIDFWYHMYGSDMGSLALEGYNSDTAEWEEIWRKDGNQANEWRNAVVEFSGYPKIRFHEWDASSYAADVAVDNILVEALEYSTEPGVWTSNTLDISDIDIEIGYLEKDIDEPEDTSILIEYSLDEGNSWHELVEGVFEEISSIENKLNIRVTLEGNTGLSPKLNVLEIKLNRDSLYGYLYHDNNPLQDVKVYLIEESSESIVSTVNTDENGKYLFYDLDGTKKYHIVTFDKGDNVDYKAKSYPYLEPLV